MNFSKNYLTWILLCRRRACHFLVKLRVFCAHLHSKERSNILRKFAKVGGKWKKLCFKKCMPCLRDLSVSWTSRWLHTAKYKNEIEPKMQCLTKSSYNEEHKKSHHENLKKSILENLPFWEPQKLHAAQLQDSIFQASQQAASLGCCCSRFGPNCKLLSVQPNQKFQHTASKAVDMCRAEHYKKRPAELYL